MPGHRNSDFDRTGLTSIRASLKSIQINRYHINPLAPRRVDSHRQAISSTGNCNLGIYLIMDKYLGTRVCSTDNKTSIYSECRQQSK